MGFAFPHDSNPVVVDWNLGLNKRDKNPNEEYYWAGVRDAIIKSVLEANKYLPRETTKVFLYGECALDERFRKVLREAVDSVLSNKIDIFALDPVYSAARGAAEMAKRTYWSYNHTKATESSGECECNEVREAVEGMRCAVEDASCVAVGRRSYTL